MEILENPRRAWRLRPKKGGRRQATQEALWLNIRSPISLAWLMPAELFAGCDTT